jgi:hypothetical protein
MQKVRPGTFFRDKDDYDQRKQDFEVEKWYVVLDMPRQGFSAFSGHNSYEEAYDFAVNKMDRHAGPEIEDIMILKYMGRDRWLNIDNEMQNLNVKKDFFYFGERNIDTKTITIQEEVKISQEDGSVVILEKGDKIQVQEARDGEDLIGSIWLDHSSKGYIYIDSYVGEEVYTFNAYDSLSDLKAGREIGGGEITLDELLDLREFKRIRL